MTDHPYQSPTDRAPSRFTDNRVEASRTNLSATTLASHTRTNQLIRGSLITGVLVTSVILALVAEPGQENPSFSIVGGAMWLGTFAASFLVPAVISHSANTVRSNDLVRMIREAEPPTRLPNELNNPLAAWSTQKLVQAAFLEGTCFLNLILWMIGASSILLVLVAINVLMMAITFPMLESLRTYLIQKSEPL